MLVGKVRMWWDLLVKATPAAPCNSHPTHALAQSLIPGEWRCLREAKLEGCGELGLAGDGVSTKKLQIPAASSLWMHDSTREEPWELRSDSKHLDKVLLDQITESFRLEGTPRVMESV